MEAGDVLRVERSQAEASGDTVIHKNGASHKADLLAHVTLYVGIPAGRPLFGENGPAGPRLLRDRAAEGDAAGGDDVILCC